MFNSKWEGKFHNMMKLQILLAVSFKSLFKISLENLDESEEIDGFIVEEITDYGYPRSFIIDSIKSNEINYATASYYLLKKRKFIEESMILNKAKKEISIDEIN